MRNRPPGRAVRPRIGAVPIASTPRTPDDDGFIYQYSLRDDHDHDVDATNAWENRTKCAKVAVVDTGIDTGHKDLKANLWRNDGEVPGNGRDDDGNGYVDDDRGVDLVDGRGSGIDGHGHGTHAAGIDRRDRQQQPRDQRPVLEVADHLRPVHGQRRPRLQQRLRRGDHLRGRPRGARHQRQLRDVGAIRRRAGGDPSTPPPTTRSSSPPPATTARASTSTRTIRPPTPTPT